MSDSRTVATTDEGVAVRTRTAAPTLTYGASKAVAVAGTQEVLGADTACRSIHIKAKTGNSGNVYIGTSNVSSALNMKVLAAGELYELVVNNVNQIWIDVDTGAEGVDYWITN